MHSTINHDTLNPKFMNIFNPSHTLTRHDLIWILESIKKKVAEEEPDLLALSQPRLLKNFHHFAEIAMMLIHQRSVCDQEVDRLKIWVTEASYGLFDDDHSN